jgi:hypothetical protein
MRRTRSFSAKVQIILCHYLHHTITRAHRTFLQSAENLVIRRAKKTSSEWVDVRNDAVVDGPNRAGRTMVWPYYLDGHPKARCFMPGSMG